MALDEYTLAAEMALKVETSEAEMPAVETVS